MAYMKRNVNIFLLLVIVVIVASLAALTTYYQSTYKNLGSKYEGKQQEIEKKISELNALGGKLNQTSKELSIKAEREVKLGSQYTDVKTAKEKVEDELGDTKNSLQKETLLRQSVQTQLQQAQYNLKLAEETISDLKGDVLRLKEVAQSCSSALNSYKSSLASCQAGSGGS